MIKKYKIENTNETYLRIWQKLQFGKQILEPSFFEEQEIPESDASYRLKVYQFGSNTRLFYLQNTLYWVTSEEKLYNYLDTGRAISLTDKYKYNYNYNNRTANLYIYNDLIITDEIIKGFEDYKDKNNLDLKVLANIGNVEIKLIFNEDLDKIKQRLEELKAEEERIKNDEEISNTQEEEKLRSLLKNYDKMELLEDPGAIIKDNYFIDKDKGLKVEFKDKIIKLFAKDDLIIERGSYYGRANNFIGLDYSRFLDLLDDIYRQGKYEEPIENKLKKLNNKWLNFKIYSYDIETKVETFVKEIKIENNVNDKGKLRFKVNGIKMPIQKMSKVLEFIGNNRGYHNDSTTIKERLTNLEKYLEQIRLYSGTQLELLQGKTIEIKLNGVCIPIHFNLIAENKNNWKVSIDNFSVERSYSDIKDTFKWLCGGGLTAISEICDTLKAGEELEEILINRVKGFVEKRRIAEEKAEGLFKEFLEKNKTRIFVKEGGYIVKGKLKNYIVKMKDEENVGVWSYPANEYVCINEKTKTGQYLCKYDKLLQFCLCMLNDGNLREEIHTIH